MRKLLTYAFWCLMLLQLSSCIQYKEVKVIQINDVGIKKITPKGIDIEVAMQIKNPNKYDISIVDSDLILLVKGTKFGAAVIKEKVKLKKKSTQEYRFTIQSTMGELTSSALPLLMGLIGKRSIDLQIKGTIKAKAKGISKKIPIDFKKNVAL